MLTFQSEHILAFNWCNLQELVFGTSFDNSLRQAIKRGEGADGVMEHEQVGTAWERACNLLTDEKNERAAAEKLKLKAESATAEEEQSEVDAVAKEFSSIRTKSNMLSAGTDAYWKAVANETVRTYVGLAVEPNTRDGVVTGISHSFLKDTLPVPGETSVVTFLDIDNLGETMGPGGNRALRKRFNPELPLLKKLVQGAMLARGAQLGCYGVA